MLVSVYKYKKNVWVKLDCFFLRMILFICNLVIYLNTYKNIYTYNIYMV